MRQHAFTQARARGAASQAHSAATRAQTETAPSDGPDSRRHRLKDLHLQRRIPVARATAPVATYALLALPRGAPGARASGAAELHVSRCWPDPLDRFPPRPAVAEREGKGSLQRARQFAGRHECDLT
jgi:hypothetical protein